MAIARVIAPVRAALALTLLAWLLAGSASASAAQRFASPGATNEGPPCTASGTSPGPCEIRAAVGGAQEGDEVIVEPGDYKDAMGNPMTDPVLVQHANVAVHAASGALPRLFFSGTASVAVAFPGDSISGIDIEASGGDPALSLGEGASADGMFVHSSGGTACRVEGPIDDSVCWMDGGAGDALFVDSSSTGPATLTLRNDTIESTVDFGLYVTPGSSSAMTLNAINVIAHGSGGAPDVLAKPAGSNFTVTINIGYSNYVTHIIGGIGPGAINETPPGSNQTTPPAFVNAGAGDFRELASSSGTVDRGHDDGALGPLDLDGNPRVLGVAPDIGAFEFVPPLPGPTLPPPVALLATVSHLGMSPSAFAAAAKGPSAAKHRHVGTRVSFRLNEAAGVRFTVQRPAAGRKVKRGKKTVCQRPGKKNHRNKKCTRYVTLPGSFTIAGKAGSNTFRFSGRLRHKKLRPGRYRLVATASAGGSRGRPTRKAFRIIR